IVRDATLSFLSSTYPGLIDGVHFANHFLTPEEAARLKSRPKSAVCRELGASVLIDDALHHAEECAEKGMRVLLFDLDGTYMWGKLPAGATLPPGVTRVRNWAEAVAQLLPPASKPPSQA
ncbi:hypothetical protein HK405_005952, partial [Cladochytrium tenue]